MAEEAVEEKAEQTEQPEEQAEQKDEVPAEAETPSGEETKGVKTDDSAKISMNQMYSLYLQPSFSKRLSEKGKRWLAKAMVNMIMADKSIDASEVSYLEDAISLVEDEEERKKLMEAAKIREPFEIDILNTDREYAGYFFFYLAMIVAADGKVKTSEVNFLAKICGKLGFPSSSAKDVLHWTTKLVKLNTERENMVDQLSRINPIFSKH